MPDSKNVDSKSSLFDRKVIRDILSKLRFLDAIDDEASDTLQTKVRKILEETRSTPESFINAYKEISIATYTILYEKLNELRTLNAFDETIEPTQLKIEAYEKVIQEILEEMTAYACEKGAILSTQAAIEEKLKALQPKIIQTVNLAVKNSATACLLRPGWLGLASLVSISNPVTATVLATVFFVAEACKIAQERFDLKNREPTTYLGISKGLWSTHSDLSKENKILRINEELISGNSTKNLPK